MQKPPAIKILVDMNLSPRWIGLLQQERFVAIHWSALGVADAPDTEIMSFAADNGYVVLTQDLDFGAILAATRGERPSVVQIRAEDISPDVIGSTVVAALRQVEPELEAGALLTIDVDRTRLRLLPLIGRKQQ
jgi:predicted nuclease of predicted toxin-antitoxin system